MERHLVPGFVLCAAVALLTGCSGSNAATPPTTRFTPLPVLVAGSVYNYSGTYSETITYASPSPTQPNSDGTYTIAEVEKVVGAGSTAPAPFDVQRTLTYTVTKAP